MTSNNKSGKKHLLLFTATATALSLSLAPLVVVESKPLSPLSSISTHHGINAAVHLSGGGAGVATKKPQHKHMASSVTTGETKRVVTEEEKFPFVSTSYSVIAKSLDSNVATTSTVSPPAAPTNKDALSPMAIACMSLLALQFGVQPILVRKYTPQTIVRSSVVLVQEVVKFAIAGTIYLTGTAKEKRAKDFEGWSIKMWIALAGLPAFLYTIQNLSSLMAYQNLEALTFNVLNQTKILSAALFCFLVMGKRQSRMQVASLVLLTLSTLVIEKIVHPGVLIGLMSRGGRTGAAALGVEGMIQGLKGLTSTFGVRGGSAGKRFTHGVLPILVASLISGLAGALTQLNLQGGGSHMSFWGKKSTNHPSAVGSRPPRNAYLFSMEMNVASIALLLASLFMSSDGRDILRTPSTFFSNWTPQTFIPVITNAIGGILVGLVTKHAGSVRKGFALIFGLLLSGLFQANGSGIRSEQVIGGLMAAASLWMHTVHPYKAQTAEVGSGRKT
ncbi:hypothetical protein HJC23_004029 [Cyclotella cryptica]|uniref:Nucleotide-sugar transporter n=1 Tax=Cyclotella cryptica TaxID=29204 RepID=A0ABD3QUD2_9STRA|eukprot:CCRYP_002018-RB/>CCRYP_002018-RB protein AED:0.01 eAED:0.01 QI:411/1/1/1/1/1/2/88/501